MTPHWEAPTPPTATLFSATRSIRSLLVGANGAIWAATEGGVLRWADTSSDTPKTWTTADGLPTNDVRGLRREPGGDVIAAFPVGSVKIGRDDTVILVSDAPATEKKADVTLITARAQTSHDTLTATPSGLVWERAGAKSQTIALPPRSRGSHVSALTSLSAKSAGVFAAGLYGDGAYRLTIPVSQNAAPQWERLPASAACPYATALAFSPSTKQLLIGTRSDGAFAWDAKTHQTTPLSLGHSLPSGDIYGIAAYQNHLWATTFDAGIVEINQAAANATLPAAVHTEVKDGRTLLPFGDKLYALRADHTVRAFDGTWKPAWPAGTLKRAEVFSLAADETNHRLLVGGWGGWAEWNGTTWKQNWGSPLLKNESITAVCADKTGAVWLGTQRRGLVRCAANGETPFQEAQGLTDDWITCLSVSPAGRLLVGTYVGGLLEYQNGRFVPRFHADKWAIRTLAWDNETALAATPVGVFREGTAATDQWKKLPTQTTGGSEAQALFSTKTGLWVGTRNGLAFLPR